MATRTTTKKVYYLRARANQQPKNLQTLVETARSNKPTVADTEVTFGGGDIVRIQHYRQNSGHGVYLHLTRYVPGEKAPTLQPKAVAAEDNEGTQPAPTGKEFKDGDCYLLIQQHHVLFCSHGIHVAKAIQYLAMLFKKCDMDQSGREFDVSPVSNLDKVKLLQEHGVRSILLSTNAFDISLPEAERGSWISRTFGKLSDEFNALMEKDDSIADQKIKEDLLVNVELRLNGNTRAAQDTQDFIEDVAESVLSDTDSPISEFAIVTQSGETVKPGSIRLQKGFRVPVIDGALSHISIWDSMESYYTELRQGNILEQ
ncbi:hypothetical protein [Halioxenophilus aromaticivorans]|uniref:Uncharacterized protein n=1 Tax=Halioxenophilus aromaticivorans TaxID=1306992 RepID=A0AAV3U6I3_9ALTE